MDILFLKSPLKKIYKFIIVICLIGLMASATDAGETNTAERWFDLGNDYFFGENGKTKDYVKAFNFYEKAAKRDLSKAQYNLGIMYLNGFGRNPNSDKAVRWFTRAAKQNNPDAQYLLGIMYRDGFGDTKNHYEAIEWFRKAANQGHVDAQIELGLMLIRFFPNSKYQEAITFFTKAAEQGNAGAQQYLGYLYCLEKKYEEALKWSLAAARKGSSKAQENIGRMYFYGQGVEQNYLQAYMWFTIASFENKKYMALVKNNLSENEIAQAESMAIKWKQNHLESETTPR